MGLSEIKGLHAPETILKDLGANYSRSSSNWGSYVEVDRSGTGPLVTGKLQSRESSCLGTVVLDCHRCMQDCSWLRQILLLKHRTVLVSGSESARLLLQMCGDDVQSSRNSRDCGMFSWLWHFPACHLCVCVDLYCRLHDCSVSLGDQISCATSFESVAAEGDQQNTSFPAGQNPGSSEAVAHELVKVLSG